MGKIAALEATDAQPVSFSKDAEEHTQKNLAACTGNTDSEMGED